MVMKLPRIKSPVLTPARPTMGRGGIGGDFHPRVTL